MRLLISGAQGMMGRDLRSLAEAAGHEVWPTDVERLVRDPEDRLDVRSYSEVSDAIDRYAPDAFLHLAALTDVDRCETEPEEAWKVNAMATESIAQLCHERDLVMVYISTGSVFAGDKPTPYHEYDRPAPVSVYSRSKYAGEEAVRRLVPHHYIVRAGWMFGGGPEDKKFVAKMIELARGREVLRAVDDKFGAPTYTRDISGRVLELLGTGRFGTYHAANEGWCSRYEMAQAIVEAAGITSCRVEPCSSAEFPLPAHRPRCEAIEGLRARLIGLEPMRPWRVALEDYIQNSLLTPQP